MTISLSIQSVSKSFSGKLALHPVSFDVHEHEAIGIAGRNGSGKSTLVKIISGLLSADSGEVTLNINGDIIEHDNYIRYIGFAAPYVNIYDEFTPRELLRITAKLRNFEWSEDKTRHLMKGLGLQEHLGEITHGYSSGMMQRMRLATALQHNPPLLILDEPTTNLDDDGIAIVRQIITEQQKHGIIILASNNAMELGWCGKIINVEMGNRSEFKNE